MNLVPFDIIRSQEVALKQQLTQTQSCWTSCNAGLALVAAGLMVVVVGGVHLLPGLSEGHQISAANLRGMHNSEGLQSVCAAAASAIELHR